MNIDGCRFAYGDPCWVGPQDDPGGRSVGGYSDSPVFGTATDPITDTQSSDLGRWPANIYQCPKPSRDERERGCEGLEDAATPGAVGNAYMGVDSAGKRSATVKNSHPTVKPLGVMKWLCKLVGGQPGSVILDTFAGSGTTVCAGVLEGFNTIGLEMDPRYVEISRARLAYWSGGGEDSEVDDGKGWTTE